MAESIVNKPVRFCTPIDLKNINADELLISIKKQEIAAYLMVTNRQAIAVDENKRGIGCCEISGIFKIPSTLARVVEIGEPFAVSCLYEINRSVVGRWSKNPPGWVRCLNCYCKEWAGLPQKPNDLFVTYRPLMEEFLQYTERDGGMGIISTGQLKESVIDHYVLQNENEGFDGGPHPKRDAKLFKWENIRLLESDFKPLQKNGADGKPGETNPASRQEYTGPVPALEQLAANWRDDPALKKGRKQELAITETIKLKGFDPLNIPDGEKGTLKILCESEYPMLFGAETAFDSTWKRGLSADPQKWRLASHASYAKRGKF